MDIIGLANTVVFENLISGGDVILPQIKKKWGNKYNFDLITTRQGARLWANLGVDVKLHIVKYTLFDRWARFIFIPLLYIVRTFYATVLLQGLLNQKKTEGKLIVYTASDFFPDVAPVFIMKLRHKNIIWVSRIYHIILHPLKRKGNIFFNMLSYLGQRLSLYLIKWKSELIVPLESTDKDLIKMGFDKNKFYISNAGVDLDLIDTVAYPDIKYDSIYVGMLTYTKGIYDLLRIWKEVVAKKPQVQLAIVGGGSPYDIDTYKRAILKNNMQNNVNYLGFIPRNEDVYSLMKASRIFVYAGHEGGWSLTMAEAMACRIPVVAYRLSMFDTAFKSGYITVPFYDTAKFAEAILRLLDNPESRISLGQEGYNESRKFGWDSVASKLAERINRL